MRSKWTGRFTSQKLIRAYYVTDTDRKGTIYYTRRGVTKTTRDFDKATPLTLSMAHHIVKSWGGTIIDLCKSPLS